MSISDKMRSEKRETRDEKREARSESKELRVASCELRVASCELRDFAKRTSEMKKDKEFVNPCGSTSLASRFSPLASYLDVTTVVAVSGGADSILLAELLYRHKIEADNPGVGKLIVAHVNHNLREAESDADEQFVRDWVTARQVNAPWLVGEFTKLNIKVDSDGLENACRTARYNWLTNICRQYGARYLFTAHNADDQIETVLYRILRGTGLDGLTGIAPMRQFIDGVTLIRPLLEYSKKEIIEQLNAWNQPYRTDSSNLTSDYARNKIRNELLPLLEREYNPNVRNSVIKLSVLATQAQEEIVTTVKEILRNAVIEQNESKIVLNRNILKTKRPYIIMECLRHLWTVQNWGLQAMGLTQWTLLSDMVLSESISSPRIFPGTIRVVVTEELLILIRN